MKTLIAFLLITGIAQASEYEIDPTKLPTISEATLILKDFLKTSQVAEKEYFCLAGDLTCRTHYRLQTAEGNPLKAFYVKFVAVDRSVGSQGYFFPVKGMPNHFIRFEDFSFDGVTSVDKIESNNVVEVLKDEHNRVAAIKGLKAPVLGTTKYVFADLSVNQEAATFKGVRLDSGNPDFSEPVEIVYKRTTIP